MEIGLYERRTADGQNGNQHSPEQIIFAVICTATVIFIIIPVSKAKN